MKLQTRESFARSQRLPIAAIFLAVFVVGEAAAQGLSGVPRRLEETVPGAAPGGKAPSGYGSGYGNQTGYPEGQAPSTGRPAASGAGYGSGYGNPGGYPEGQAPAAASPQSGAPGSGYGQPGGYGNEMADSAGGPGYGPESGYGGPAGALSRRPGAARGGPGGNMLALGSNLGPLGEFDLAALFAPRPEAVEVETGPVLKRESEQAFASGNYALALELAFAHMAAEYPHSIVDIQTVKYSTLLRRPVWNVRFGVSMAVRGGSSTSDPQPIRETTSSRRVAQAPSGGRRPTGRQQQQVEPDMEMMEGDMMGMEEEMQEMQEPNMADFGDPNAGAPRSRTRVEDAGPTRSMLDPATSEELDMNLGLVAKVVGEQFSKRFHAGDFGPILASVNAPEPAEPVRGGARAPAAPAPLPGGSISGDLADTMDMVAEPLPMWLPGIAYLGQGTWDEIHPLARDAKFDLVLHFDVILKKGRNETMQNICRCRIMHVGSGKSVGVSKGMDNREASQLATSGRSGERDYVDEKLAALWSVMDRSVKTIDLPKLSAPVAKKRVAALMGGSSAQTLRTLAEIRLYQAQQLISDDEVETAFDIVGGPEALMLLYGPRNERLAMARKWAIRAQGGQVDN